LFVGVFATYMNYGRYKKYFNVTIVQDSCTAVSKRAVFGNFRDVAGGAGALGWVQRQLAFMRESKVLLCLS
jgi:hypothetical protein